MLIPIARAIASQGLVTFPALDYHGPPSGSPASRSAFGPFDFSGPKIWLGAITCLFG